jgi:hypothetical protein
MGLLLLILALSGCRLIRIEEGERTPVEYTVLDRREIPEDLETLISSKQTSEFQMTYQKGEDLYLVRGYGQQLSGGYSIRVDDLSESENALFLKTTLLGPSEDNAGSEPSCPYLVIKIKAIDKPVEFL